MNFSMLILSTLLSSRYAALNAIPENKTAERQTPLPEENMTADQMIAYNGYPVETHKAQTEDGYILTLHRIPSGRIGNNDASKNQSLKQAVILQHGLATTSTNWITNLPNQSLGYILADNGYDVWLGNVRGNKYSKEHTHLSANHSKFWEFSWEDMAEKDLPAMIDYILNVTGNRQIIYVGHSQGTLLGFAKFSSNLDFAKKIKSFVALAPVSTVHYITSPVRYLAPFTWPLQKTLELFGDYSLGRLTWMLNYVKPTCDLVPETQMLCENVMFFFAGVETKAHLNETRIPIYIAHNPDDTSMKNIVHFGQMVNSGRMQRFDYGFLKNMAVYEQFWPPEYHTEMMEVETAVFWSPKDAFADPSDVLPLLAKIKNLRKNVRIDEYSHLDFLWALDAPSRVYAEILEFIKSAA